MPELDPRLVRVSLQMGDSFVRVPLAPVTTLKQYDQGLDISAQGTKYASALQGDSSVKINNLTKADRDYLLTALSPFNLNRTPKLCIVEAGRVSTGLSEVYRGNISACIPSQPPDIALELKLQTAQFQKGAIVSAQQPNAVALSQIAKQVAADTGLTLTFEATDKQITNYTFTGASLKQVDKLGELGGVNAFVDGAKLIVKDWNVPLKGQLRILDADSGMIGIPQLTEFGVRLTYLLDNQSTLGGALQVKSKIYPSVDGTYTITQLAFNITSRDTPFYWIADCTRRSDSGGAILPVIIPKRSGMRARK